MQTPDARADRVLLVVDRDDHVEDGSRGHRAGHHEAWVVVDAVPPVDDSGWVRS